MYKITSISGIISTSPPIELSGRSAILFAYSITLTVAVPAKKQRQALTRC